MPHSIAQRQYRQAIVLRTPAPASLRGPGDNYHPENSHVIPASKRTPDAEHLGAVAPPQNTALEKEIRIAEFRANEFMGSLLVPRERLVEQALAHAPDFDVGIERADGLSDELHAATPRLVEQGAFGFVGMESLQHELAAIFGVNPKFIRVRMEE